MAGERVLDLVRQGQLHGIFLSVPESGIRTECWIRRESLNHWIAHRDADLARYMARPEAKRALGLTDCTVVKVAAAGAIRYVKGPERNFPSGFFYFLREDVIKKCSPVKRFRSEVPALASVELSQIIENRCRLWVLRSEFLLGDSQGPLVQRFGLGKLSL